MSTLERLLDFYVPTLWKESERFAKIKTLSISLELLQGGRRVALIYFFSLVWVVVFTVATFSIVFYEVMNYATTGGIQIDGFVWFAAAIWLISIGFASLFLREKRWLRAFDVQKKIDLILSLEAANAKSASADRILSEQNLAKTIDRILEEKLEKYAQKNAS